MPVVIEEKFDSRLSVAGDNPSVELRYIVFGTSDDLVAKSELASASPSEYDDLPRQSIQIEPLANDIWEGSVRYGLTESNDPPMTGESSFAFDTGGAGSVAGCVIGSNVAVVRGGGRVEGTAGLCGDIAGRIRGDRRHLIGRLRQRRDRA